jgi:hypothetical protein
LDWRRHDNRDIAATCHDEIEVERMILADERMMRRSGGDEGGQKLILLLLEEEEGERGWNCIARRVMQALGGREWK